MSNEWAAVWIRARGYEPEPEPGWVTGRKPDFFCAGKAPFWVQVKTFEPTAYDVLQGRAWQDFRARINRLEGLTGNVHASISPTYSELSGKRAAPGAAQGKRTSALSNERTGRTPSMRRPRMSSARLAGRRVRCSARSGSDRQGECDILRRSTSVRARIPRRCCPVNRRLHHGDILWLTVGLRQVADCRIEHPPFPDASGPSDGVVSHS